MCELVDERDLRAAGEHGVDVHLLERRPAVLDPSAWDDLEVADLLGGLRPAVCLDVADDDVLAVAGAAPSFVEHGVRLADACCRAEIDAKLAPRHGERLRLLVEGEVELEDVDPGLAEEAEGPSVGVLVDEAQYRGEREPADACDSRRLYASVLR